MSFPRAQLNFLEGLNRVLPTASSAYSLFLARVKFQAFLEVTMPEDGNKWCVHSGKRSGQAFFRPSELAHSLITKRGLEIALEKPSCCCCCCCRGKSCSRVLRTLCDGSFKHYVSLVKHRYPYGHIIGLKIVFRCLNKQRASSPKRCLHAHILQTEQALCAV